MRGLRAAATVVAWVACAACGTSENGTAGTAGGAGAAGSPGPAGSQGERGPAGPAGEAGASATAPPTPVTAKNGTRIKIRKTTETTADGLEVVTVGGYVDSAKANEPCGAYTTVDGQLRCLPLPGAGVGSGVVVYDATCTQPMVTVYGATQPTRYILGAETAGAEYRYRVFSATPSGATQACTKAGPTSCTCRTLQPADEVAYDTEIPAADWAAITRTAGVL